MFLELTVWWGHWWLDWVYIRGGKTMWLLCKTVLTSDRGNESEVCIIVLWHNSLISNANSYSSFLSVTKGTLDWKNVFWPAMSTMIWKKEFWSKQKNIYSLERGAGLRNGKSGILSSTSLLMMSTKGLGQLR